MQTSRVFHTDLDRVIDGGLWKTGPPVLGGNVKLQESEPAVVGDTSAECAALQGHERLPLPALVETGRCQKGSCVIMLQHEAMTPRPHRDLVTPFHLTFPRDQLSV